LQSNPDVISSKRTWRSRTIGWAIEVGKRKFSKQKHYFQESVWTSGYRFYNGVSTIKCSTVTEE
jgi:hypothetical protein